MILCPRLSRISGTEEKAGSITIILLFRPITRLNSGLRTRGGAALSGTTKFVLISAGSKREGTQRESLQGERRQPAQGPGSATPERWRVGGRHIWEWKGQGGLEMNPTVIRSLLGGGRHQCSDGQKTGQKPRKHAVGQQRRRVRASGWGHPDGRLLLGLEGRKLVDNVGCQLDTQPLPLEMREQRDRQNPHQTLPDKVAGAHLEPETQDCGVPSALLSSARRPEPTGPRACSTQNKAKAALSQLELDFVSALLLVLCKLGQITLSL